MAHDTHFTKENKKASLLPFDEDEDDNGQEDTPTILPSQTKSAAASQHRKDLIITCAASVGSYKQVPLSQSASPAPIRKKQKMIHDPDSGVLNAAMRRSKGSRPKSYSQPKSGDRMLGYNPPPSSSGRSDVGTRQDTEALNNATNDAIKSEETERPPSRCLSTTFDDDNASDQKVVEGPSGEDLAKVKTEE